MKILITGSAGLIGSEAARYFASKGDTVIGVDNDMRAQFFGADASTAWNLQELSRELGSSYVHHAADIRDARALEEIIKPIASTLRAIIHTAAQPSHDWAARDPHTDFGVNAIGTLNLLQLARTYCPEVSFIFTSTNKVYGDNPNFLPLVEQETRWEIDSTHPYFNGIPEEMSIDHTKHSLFGASKVAADILTQEYGKYFNMPTVCFRGGCLTGPRHSGTMLHGFLSYLMKCAVTGQQYNIFGYKGKQVRDNIHSLDLVKMFERFIEAPRSGVVYNAGGGRFSNCSLAEAVTISREISGKTLNAVYQEQNRIGDHIWYISSLEKFRRDYPGWELQYSVKDILEQIYRDNKDRWLSSGA